MIETNDLTIQVFREFDDSIRHVTTLKREDVESVVVEIREHGSPEDADAKLFSVFVNGEMLAGNLGFDGRVPCDQCGKRINGDKQSSIDLTIRSARLATSRRWATCSDKCRDEWWTSSSAEDLLEYTEDRSRDHCLHPDDVNVRVEMSHKKDREPFKPVAVYGFDRAESINVWFKTAEAEDHKLKSRPSVIRRATK